MVICHPAGMILSGAKIAPMVKSMVPSITDRGENCPPVMMTSSISSKKSNEEYLTAAMNNEWKCLDMHSFDGFQNPEVVEIPLENLFVDESPKIFHINHLRITIMRLLNSNATLLLFGVAIILNSITTVAMLQKLSGDSMTPRNDNTTHQSTVKR